MAIGDSTLKETAGNLVMGGGKVTGAGAATVAGDLVRYEQSVLITGANAFTADQSMGSHNLTNVLDPTSAQHAATKNYNDTRLHVLGCPWGSNAMGATASARFLNAGATGSAESATESVSSFVIPFACTLKGIQVWHGGALTTDSVTYTIRLAPQGINSADTAITCTVANNTTLGSGTGSVAVVAGDVIGIKAVQTSTQASAGVVRATIYFSSAA